MSAKIIYIFTIIILAFNFTGCTKEGDLYSTEAGDLYDQNGTLVSSFNSDPTIALFNSGISSAVDMIFDSDDTLYIANSSTIYKITKNGTQTTFKTISGGNIKDLAIDSSHNIYALDGYDKMVKITQSGTLTTIKNDGTYMYSIAIDSNDDIYYSNYTDDIVYKLNQSGSDIVVSPDMNSNLYGLEIDSNGKFYIREYYGIYKINNTTSSSRSINSYSKDFVINSNNIIYSVTSSNVYKNNDQVFTEFSSYLTNPRLIAVNSYDNIYIYKNDGKIYKIELYVDDSTPRDVTFLNGSLSWRTALNAVSYNVYRSSTSNGTYTKLNDSTITDRSYVVNASGTTPTTKLYYKVSSILTDGTESAKSDYIENILEGESTDDLVSVGGSLTFSGDGWISTTSHHQSGTKSAQSNAIGSNSSTCIKTSVSGAGTLSFYWEVSSESNYDYLKFYVNDIAQSGAISGSTTWALKTHTTTSAGTTNYKWCYEKDAYTVGGSDAGWLDSVKFVAQ